MWLPMVIIMGLPPLNESPSEKEGKLEREYPGGGWYLALNESPSEKEGKSSRIDSNNPINRPSMKVPPKRKGNPQNSIVFELVHDPQ